VSILCTCCSHCFYVIEQGVDIVCLPGVIRVVGNIGRVSHSSSICVCKAFIAFQNGVVWLGQ
jgi:hypothetical protein